MSKTTATNTNHNQVIINIVTPHVQMPGVQILRPEEIMALAEKEQKDQRSQKLEGRFIDIIKYDFIVKKEDIEAGVLGNTPENPKKNKKRPMTANANIKKTMDNKLAMTSTNFKMKKTKEKIKKDDPEDKKEIEELEPENGEVEEKNQEEAKNDELKENQEELPKINQYSDEKEEVNNEETFEKVQNKEEELENNEAYIEKGDDEREEGDEEKEIEEDVKEKQFEDEEEKTMCIEKKSSTYQSNMANVNLFILY